MAKKKTKRINRSKRRTSFDKILSRRSIFLLGITIFVFLVIITRLFQVMIVDKKEYEKKLTKLSYDDVEGPSSPRGRIYDRNYNILVDNVAVKTIYYKKQKTNTTKKEIELAYLVAPHIELDISKLTIDMKKDFYLKKYPTKAKKLITQNEWTALEERKITSSDILKRQKERITDNILNSFTNDDNKATYIYYLMNKGYAYDDKIIKTNVTEEEYAYFTENSNNLSGFNTRLDWERTYPYGDTLKTILGNVSSATQGLPAEEKAYYLANGYSLSDRVGTSYIEKQYENYLHGTKEKYEVVNSKTLSLISEGKRGNDIVLNIDIKLQQEVDRILSQQVISAKGEQNTAYYDHSFVILQDPKDGGILAISGKQAVLENGHWVAKDYTPAILTSPVTPGSVVKGASMLVGYNNGGVEIGEYMRDECVKISGAPEKCSSVDNLGTIDDITALAKSSNVYQFKIAMRLSGVEYYHGVYVPFRQDVFDKYRKMYNSFGLGVKTEIDLPVESIGVSGKGKDKSSGNLLDYVMGQYETYTPMQLSQYITTFAGDSKERIKPQMLREVHEATNTEALGKIIYKSKREVLNKVDTKDEYFNRVKEGFHAVTMRGDGYGRGYVAYDHDSAGKTGTSQSFIDTDDDGRIDTETITSSFLGYVPSVNPRFTITVVSPNSSYPNSKSDYVSLVTMRISKEITAKYFGMYGY